MNSRLRSRAASFDVPARRQAIALTAEWLIQLDRTREDRDLTVLHQLIAESAATAPHEVLRELIWLAGGAFEVLADLLDREPLEVLREGPGRREVIRQESSKEGTDMPFTSTIPSTFGPAVTPMTSMSVDEPEPETDEPETDKEEE